MKIRIGGETARHFRPSFSSHCGESSAPSRIELFILSRFRFERQLGVEVGRDDQGNRGD